MLRGDSLGPQWAVDNAWQEDLTEEETHALLRKAADVVKKRRMEMPAVLALEMHKPIATYTGNMAVVFAPFLGPILGPESFRDYSRLLKDRHNVERLIAMIEDDVKREKEERPR